MSVLERILAGIRLDGVVTDIRMGPLWTMVLVETAVGPRAGLASTQLAHDLEHGRPAVRDAGRLVGLKASELAALALADSPSEACLGLAAINALIEVDEAAYTERNAEEIILEKALQRGSVAIVGHFPFIPRLREAVEQCWVLELNPQPGDLPAQQAAAILPRAAVVAITGMTLANRTFEDLAAMCNPAAYVLVLGATTPLTPVLFEYGVDAVSGTLLKNDQIPAALAAVSQGANFRQIPGKRLITLERVTQ